MQKKKVNLLHRAGRVMLCAMALLALGACRDDLQEPKGKTSEQTPQSSIDNYIGKVNIVVEATLEPMPDQSGRSLNFSLMDRAQRIGVDGKTVPPGADYTDEFAPRMALTEGSTVRGFLIFLHSNGTIVRESVDFKVIEGVKKADGTVDPTAKNRVQFSDNIDFPAGVTLTDEFNNSSNNVISGLYPDRMDAANTTKGSGWHVMAMIGHAATTSYYPTSDAPSGSEENRLLVGYFVNPGLRSNASDSYAIAQFSGDNIELNTPCASAWMPLYITKAPPTTDSHTGELKESPVTGVNLDLHFKPQGVTLQYDIASMANDTQDLRRVGLVSNVLDFEGYYDLNAASIQEAYRNKDGDGYGIPNWVPKPPSMYDLSMNYAPASDAPLSSGARVFPWDMPTLSSDRANALNNWGGDAGHTWSIEQASLLSLLPLGNSSQRMTGRPNTFPWLNAKKLWLFYPLGGTYRRGKRYLERRLFYFWGMPRPQQRIPAENKRATYFFVSSYSLLTDNDAMDAGVDGFDTDMYRDFINYAIEKNNELIELGAKVRAEKDEDKKKDLQADYDRDKKYYETFEGSNPYRNYFPGPLFPALNRAKEASVNYIRQANTGRITPRSQPLMILHQTNRTFPERKVYHAQGVIRPDLMLTEVIHQKHDGKNYSLLEVYNPTVEPVDLSQYAVVRLIPSDNGAYLTFRGPNGQPVESLSQALVLPLTALRGRANPFEGSALSTLALAGYTYGDPSQRLKPVYYDNERGYSMILKGFWPGEWGLTTVEDVSSTHPDRSLVLLEGQSILLGGSGYINSPVTRKLYYRYSTDLIPSNDWFRPLYNLMESVNDKWLLRYAYAYADGVKQSDNTYGAGTLDYEPGDAFALIKKTSTGWQIIDATGPVGPKHLAFAGTYDSFKTEMAKYKGVESFSQQRTSGVNYPFIAPFRTKRLYPTEWSDDWNIRTEVRQFTPGYRFLHYDDDASQHLSLSDWDYHTKRTPIDPNFPTYQNARPTRGY